MRVTRFGDANLDGVVNAADYLSLDGGFVGRLSSWSIGDLNYDGVIDGSDYTLADNAFNRQSPAVPAAEVAAAAPGRPASGRPASNPPAAPAPDWDAADVTERRKHARGLAWPPIDRRSADDDRSCGR